MYTRPNNERKPNVNIIYYVLTLKIDLCGTGKYKLKISEDIEIKNQIREFLLLDNLTTRICVRYK